jgi:hypothetical protein
MHRLFRSIFLLLICQLLFNLFCTLIGVGHPYNIFLFEPNDRFADILKTSDSFGVADTWVGDNSWYRPLLNALPPFQLLIEISFGFLVKILNVNAIFLLFTVYLFIIYAIFLSIKNFVDISDKIALFLICVINYGFIFFLDRGNSSIFTVLLLILFLANIDKPKQSMLFLALCISIKITPLFFFIIIYLYQKENIKAYIYYLLLYLIFINTFSFILVNNFYRIYLHETYNLNTFLVGGKMYLKTYLYNGEGISYGSSLITLISLSLLIIKKLFSLNENIYLPLSQISLILLILSYCYILLNIKYFTKNKFTLILFVFTTYLLFSPVTGDYYISYFALPLLFYNNKDNAKYFIPLVLLLAPKNYLFYHTYSIQIILNPILMLWILFIINKELAIKKMYN